MEGDITYIATQEGWLYLVVVIDPFSRRVVGWALNISNPVAAGPRFPIGYTLADGARRHA